MATAAMSTGLTEASQRGPGVATGVVSVIVGSGEDGCTASPSTRL